MDMDFAKCVVYYVMPAFCLQDRHDHSSQPWLWQIATACLLFHYNVCVYIFIVLHVV